jgi:hypothetical protein
MLVEVAPAPAASSTPAAPAARWHFQSAEEACDRGDDDGEADALVQAVCIAPAVFGGGANEPGLWLVMPVSTSRRGEDAAAIVSTAWVVLWVWSDGRVVEGPRFVSTKEVAYETQSDTPEIGTLRHLFDYDGDGRSELLLPVRQLEHAREGPRRLWLLTLDSSGKIAAYAPELGNVVWAEDVDGDQRPDLMIDPWNNFSDDGYPVHSSIRRDGWRLAHALVGGSFSLTDAVARGHQPEP